MRNTTTTTQEETTMTKFMDKVIKTLKYTFDLTTDENGMVCRSNGTIISHRVNFLMTMKLRQVITEDAQDVDHAIDWTQAQKELRVPKVLPPLPGESTAKTHGPNQEFKNILVRGGRTGRKIHLASDGGSGSYCGHWFKAHTSHFKVADDTPENRTRYVRNLCTKCFSENSIAQALSNQEVK